MVNGKPDLYFGKVSTEMQLIKELNNRNIENFIKEDHIILYPKSDIRKNDITTN